MVDTVSVEGLQVRDNLTLEVQPLACCPDCRVLLCVTYTGSVFDRGTTALIE